MELRLQLTDSFLFSHDPKSQTRSYLLSDMRTFTFEAIQRIQDFQFLTDSSGYVLGEGGQLYRFRGNRTELVPTPTNFTVTQFHFLDATHGAVAGNFRPAALSVPQGSTGSVGAVVQPGSMGVAVRAASAQRPVTA